MKSNYELASRSYDLGTETAFTVLAKANKLASKGQNIINLGIGQPDFKTPEHIVEAGIKALRDGHHGYTQSTGIPNLREAVSNDIKKRYNQNISPENTLKKFFPYSLFLKNFLTFNLNRYLKEKNTIINGMKR